MKNRSALQFVLIIGIANLGMLLAQLGRYDEAIPHLRATLQMVPNEPAARETLEAIEATRR